MTTVAGCRWVAAALFAVAIGLLSFAALPRYQTIHLAGLYVARTDRWTGEIRLCRGSRAGGPFVCAAPQIRADSSK